MLNRLILTIVALMMVGRVSMAQTVTENKVFPVGEEFVLEAYYNLGFIWAKVGVAEFKVGEDEHGNYDFRVKMYNLPKWDWLYEVHTEHHAVCTKAMKPLYMECDVKDNGAVYTDKYVFEEKGDKNAIHRHRVTVRDSQKVAFDTVFIMPKEASDIINAIYMARNYLLKLKEQSPMPKDIPFYPLFGNGSHKIVGNIGDTTRIKTREGETYLCREYTASVGTGTIVAKDPIYAYLTDDERMIPVLVEAKLSIGNVKIYLKSYKVNK